MKFISSFTVLFIISSELNFFRKQQIGTTICLMQQMSIDYSICLNVICDTVQFKLLFVSVPCVCTLYSALGFILFFHGSESDQTSVLSPCGLATFRCMTQMKQIHSIVLMLCFTNKTAVCSDSSQSFATHCTKAALCKLLSLFLHHGPCSTLS